MPALQTAGPNVFELSFEETKIIYSPNASAAGPHLHYHGPMGQYSFEGEEIQTFRSARGLEISVTLDQVSHLRTITLTVFLPDLEFEGATSELSFRTIGIQASRRRAMTSVGAPISSEPLELDGLARNVAYQDENAAVLL